MSSNIKVAIRVRPLIQREIDSNMESLWGVSDHKFVFQNSSRANSYCFDCVFGTDEDNSKVYQTLCSKIVDSVMDGFNGTIFAYGQTSSGKTYTMDGKNGIIPSAISDIFSAIDNMPDREFLLRVSYMEIYNEIVSDLLNPEGKNLKVQESPNGVVSVIGLKEVEIKNPQDALQLMKNGRQSRHCEETEMNQKSSRSHAIFRMIVESRMCNCDLNDDVSVSQLNLVDLAGSENTSQSGHHTGMRFKEGVYINQSLFALSLVIQQLSDRKKFVNYRDSSLTRILQNSLGGNANTLMICTITPAALEQTLSTLKFASRAKRIKNKPVANVVSSDQALLKRYTKQIRMLTDKLNEFQKPGKKESSKILKELEEKNQQNEDLKQQIETLKQKFIVSQFKSSPLPSIPRPSRRETWCFGPSMGINRGPKLLEFRPLSNHYALPPLQEENMSPLLSDLSESNCCIDIGNDHTPRSSVSTNLVSVECQTEDPSLGRDKTETIRKFHSSFILLKTHNTALKQELDELKEFTTLEKQLMFEDTTEAWNKEKQELEIQLQTLLNAEQEASQIASNLKVMTERATQVMNFTPAKSVVGKSQQTTPRPMVFQNILNEVDQFICNAKILMDEQGTQVNISTPTKPVPVSKLQQTSPHLLQTSREELDHNCKVETNELGIQVTSTPVKLIVVGKSQQTTPQNANCQSDQLRTNYKVDMTQVHEFEPIKSIPVSPTTAQSLPCVSTNSILESFNTELIDLQLTAEQFKASTSSWQSILLSGDGFQNMMINTLKNEINANNLLVDQLSSLRVSHSTMLKQLKDQCYCKDKELRNAHLREEQLKDIVKKRKDELINLAKEFLDYKKERKAEKGALLKTISYLRIKLNEIFPIMSGLGSRVTIAENKVKVITEFYKKKLEDSTKEYTIVKDENRGLNDALKSKEEEFNVKIMELHNEHLQKLERIIESSEEEKLELKHLLLSQHENNVKKLQTQHELELCKKNCATRLEDVKQIILDFNKCISNSKQDCKMSTSKESEFNSKILTLKHANKTLEERLLSANNKVQHLEVELSTTSAYVSEMGAINNSSVVKTDYVSSNSINDTDKAHEISKLKESNKDLENQLLLTNAKIKQLELDHYNATVELCHAQDNVKELSSRCTIEKSTMTDAKEEKCEKSVSLLSQWEDMVIQADSGWKDLFADSGEQKIDKKSPEVESLEKRIHDLEEEKKSHIEKVSVYKSELRRLQSSHETSTVGSTQLKKMSVIGEDLPTAGSGVVEQLSVYELQAVIRRKDRELKKLHSYISRKKQSDLNKADQPRSCTNKENFEHILATK